MDISLRDHGDVVIVDLTDRLTAAVAPRLRTAVNDLVADGRARIVIDLSQVTFIDSSGLGALVGALKAARTAGGDLRIAGAGEQVKHVLRLTNLDRVLHVHTTAESAFDGH